MATSTIDLMEQAEAALLSGEKRFIAIMDKTGDTKVTWDRNNSDEVSNARETFQRLKKKGYEAYSVRSGAKGSLITEFDSDAEAIIMAPRTVGG